MNTSAPSPTVATEIGEDVTCSIFTGLLSDLVGGGTVHKAFQIRYRTDVRYNRNSARALTRRDGASMPSTADRTRRSKTDRHAAQAQRRASAPHPGHAVQGARQGRVRVRTSSAAAAWRFGSRRRPRIRERCAAFDARRTREETAEIWPRPRRIAIAATRPGRAGTTGKARPNSYRRDIALVQQAYSGRAWCGTDTSLANAPKSAPHQDAQAGTNFLAKRTCS